MGSSMLNHVCNDNNVQNQLFFFTFTNCMNHISEKQNSPVEISTGGCPLSKSVITLKP